jgi:hypothetical protein
MKKNKKFISSFFCKFSYIIYYIYIIEIINIII